MEFVSCNDLKSYFCSILNEFSGEGSKLVLISRTSELSTFAPAMPAALALSEHPNTLIILHPETATYYSEEICEAQGNAAVRIAPTLGDVLTTLGAVAAGPAATEKCTIIIPDLAPYVPDAPRTAAFVAATLRHVLTRTAARLVVGLPDGVPQPLAERFSDALVSVSAVEVRSEPGLWQLIYAGGAESGGLWAIPGRARWWECQG